MIRYNELNNMKIKIICSVLGTRICEIIEYYKTITNSLYNLVYKCMYIIYTMEKQIRKKTMVIITHI